jgi:hypothetical protein
VLSFKGLFIGIDRYAFPDVNWLSCARRHAAALHGLFTDSTGGEMVLLTDEQATRAAVEEEFQRLEGAAPDDVVVVAFSGHGSETHELVAYDTDPYDIPGTSIPLTTLGEWCGRIPCRRLLITKFNGPNDFSEAKVELNLGVIKGISSTTIGDYDSSFQKYAGLFGKNGFVLRLAETFGHEANHGEFAINDPAQGSNIQRLVNDATGAVLRANRARLPIPPDVLQLIKQKDQALVPTERFPQQQEKIINKELQPK